jgi:hypothetical protein
MLSASPQFTAHATGQVRPLSWQVLMAFEKAFDPSITFFTLDQSVLDGPDLLAPDDDSDELSDWHRYAYTDYSDRVIEFEWSRQEDTPSSVSLAMADVVFNNYDDFFTPNSGSAIEDFILPRRPIRLFAGLGGENVPAFVGLSEKMPVIDAKAKTARFHCVDFLAALFERSLDEVVMLQNARTDEALAHLFDAMGLPASQYVLDAGMNRIPFVFFDKGLKLGEAVRELMEAEMGRLYMDERGVIRFKNRQNFSDSPVYFFDRGNTIEAKVSEQNDIINQATVTGKVRAVQDLQPIWRLASPKLIPAGGTIEVWADFDDPATTCHDPTVGQQSDSYFLANVTDDPDSTPVTSGITLTDSTLFGKSFKMTFENANSFGVFLTEIELWGTPAKVVNTINITDEDAASIAKYEVQPRQIENDYIQSTSAAQTIAAVLIDDYKEYGSQLELTVKGSPALQLGDAVTVGVGSLSGLHRITKAVNRYLPGQFRQVLKVRQRTVRTYFQLDVSQLNGTHVLSP